jgi:small subunit ribosomal protein S6
MKQYELLFIIPGTLTEEEVQPLVATVESELTAIEASDVVLSNLGKAKLAYPIRHIRYGYFYNVVFSADPSTVPALVHKLNLQRNYLRVLLSTATVSGKTRDNAPAELITIEKKQDLIDERKKAMARHREETVQSTVPKVATTPVEAVVEEEVQETPAEPTPKPESPTIDIDKELDKIVEGTDISESL